MKFLSLSLSIFPSINEFLIRNVFILFDVFLGKAQRSLYYSYGTFGECSASLLRPCQDDAYCGIIDILLSILNIFRMNSLPPISARSKAATTSEKKY